MAPFFSGLAAVLAITTIQAVRHTDGLATLASGFGAATAGTIAAAAALDARSARRVLR